MAIVVLNSQLTFEECNRRKGSNCFSVSSHLLFLVFVITSGHRDSSIISLQPEEPPLTFLEVRICWGQSYSALIHLKMSLFILHLWKMVLLDIFLIWQTFYSVTFSSDAIVIFVTKYPLTVLSLFPLWNKSLFVSGCFFIFVFQQLAPRDLGWLSLSLSCSGFARFSGSADCCFR